MPGRRTGILQCSVGILLLLIAGCGKHTLNDPYPAKDKDANVYYSSFTERPKTLDPARSYSTNEVIFTAQIYEPPLQYHYLKRPYTLAPLTASILPIPMYLDKKGEILPPNTPEEAIALTLYDITIKPGIYYQPHPAFARDQNGNYYYHHLTAKDVEHIYTLDDFKHLGTREVTADDYVYEIKRLADPQVQSPIFAFMSNYIVGLKEYAKLLQDQSDRLQKTAPNAALFLDYRQWPLIGARAIDRYNYRITIKGKYPQFLFWLAMPFFAPIPWEADYFYAQSGLQERNISFDWYPVGSGPYMLAENNPNLEMKLSRNPNFHGEVYPDSDNPRDRERGFLLNAGKRLPFIDNIIFSLEKESIPRWSKFLQGYYDTSTISSDSFDQAIRINENGKPQLTAEMRDKAIQLETSVDLSIFYQGFNMLDEVVGGYTERARKLRQAISIAIDYEDYISIFLNGRGIAAQGPLPPGIFGYEKGAPGINPYVYRWNNDKVERRSLDDAKQLLVEAGYPNGRDQKTGQTLLLNYDTIASNGPDDKSRLDWMRKQFAKLGIELAIRSTTYNRFQEKMRNGDVQIYSWGWQADYPDPENFLFLLYGPNGKVKFGGENAANYNNAEFDRLFEKMKNLPNDSIRQGLINQMVEILRRDAPWVWGFNPLQFTLRQTWVDPSKPNVMANNTLKYQRIDPELRAEKRARWNRPIWWPLLIIFGILTVSTIPVFIKYWQKEHRAPERK